LTSSFCSSGTSSVSSSVTISVVPATVVAATVVGAAVVAARVVDLTAGAVVGAVVDVVVVCVIVIVVISGMLVVSGTASTASGTNALCLLWLASLPWKGSNSENLWLFFSSAVARAARETTAEQNS